MVKFYINKLMQVYILEMVEFYKRIREISVML